jgi:hypothetical protein
VHVDPAYTSRTCAECGHIDRANRVSQAWFVCRNCGRGPERLPQHARSCAGVVATRGLADGPCPTPEAPGWGWTQTQHHLQ